MYKAKDNSEYSFLDFNQPLGLHMNPNNRWIKLADLIPWDEYEERYASRFTSTLGNAAKPCRMALGALIIQKKLGFSDRELVEEIAVRDIRKQLLLMQVRWSPSGNGSMSICLSS